MVSLYSAAHETLAHVLLLNCWGHVMLRVKDFVSLTLPFVILLQQFTVGNWQRCFSKCSSLVNWDA